MAETAIKRAADKMGFNASDIAERVGVSRQAVEAWFRGEYRPDGEKATALMVLLGLTWGEVHPPRAEKVSNG